MPFARERIGPGPRQPQVILVETNNSLLTEVAGPLPFASPNQAAKCNHQPTLDLPVLHDFQPAGKQGARSLKFVETKARPPYCGVVPSGSFGGITVYSGAPLIMPEACCEVGASDGGCLGNVAIKITNSIPTPSLSNQPL